mmetsp:Transcript_11841/g.23585  ORF Transcript_11841/g.23585 Transcript_11841/m.23585 type:complete len:90 (-) Transcript_11841:186-455(-)
MKVQEISSLSELLDDSDGTCVSDLVVVSVGVVVVFTGGNLCGAVGICVGTLVNLCICDLVCLSTGDPVGSGGCDFNGPIGLCVCSFSGV